MSAMTPTHTITALRDHAEVHFAIGGLWDLEGMKRFLFDLGEAAKPFMKAGTPFDVIGDFTGFVPQDRATADAIRDSIAAGTRNGLRRFAVLAASPLVRMQYRRIAQGAEVEYFESRAEATAWLRRV
jgi:hypothetical protein